MSYATKFQILERRLQIYKINDLTIGCIIVLLSSKDYKYNYKIEGENTAMSSTMF